MKTAQWSPWQFAMELFGWSLRFEYNDDGWTCDGERDGRQVRGTGVNGHQAFMDAWRQAANAG